MSTQQEGKEVTIGPISIKVDTEGTYLKINQTINDALLTAILKKEGLPTLEPKVSATLRKHLGEWIKITDRKLHRDAFVEVVESPDMLKARLIYHPAIGGGKDLTPEEVMSILIEREGIVPEFIDPNAVKNAISKPGNAVVVAEGIPPKPGLDAKIVIVPMQKNASEDDEAAHKRLDWHEASSSVITVKAGEPVVEKVPPTEGEPGTGVKGEVIPPTPGKDIDLQTVQGKGLELEENIRLVATRTGILKQEDGRFHIDEIFVVEGDLDFEVGNIKDVKHIEIRGNVLPGFYIRVDGMVIVGGSVENATIEAGDSVYVRGIVVGDKGGYIKAGGFVYAKEFISANVDAGDTVYTDSGFRHSNIVAGKHIIATNPKSRTSGGSLKARGSVYLGIVGNLHGTKTEIRAGYVEDLKERITTINEEIEALKGKKEGLQKALTLVGRPDARVKTQKAIESLDVMIKEKEEAKKKIDKIVKQAIYQEIYVAGKAHPGVQFILADVYVYHVNDEIERSVVKINEEGEFAPVPWREPKFKIKPPQARMPKG